MRKKVLPLASVLVLLAGCGGGWDDSGPVTRWLTRAVAVADLDGDGATDVVSLIHQSADGVATGGMLSLRFGSANRLQAFLPPVRIPVGIQPRDLVVADVNGDGRPDLVVVDESRDAQGACAVTLLLHDPVGTRDFRAPVRIATGTRVPRRVAVGDLNGDGRADLALVAASGKSLLVAFQGPDRSFQAPLDVPLDVPLDGEPQAVAIGPLQKNLPENALFAATDAGTLSVLLQAPGTPKGFEAPKTFRAAEHPTAIVLAEFNGNGYTDVAVADSGEGMPGSPGSVRLLLQNIRILTSCVRCVAFDPAVTLPTGDGVTRALVAADLDGNGQTDLVTANAGVPGDPGSETVLLQVKGKPGTFQAPVLYQGYWGPEALAWGDLDGDSHPDLVVGDGDTLVRYQDPRSHGRFYPPLILLR